MLKARPETVAVQKRSERHGVLVPLERALAHLRAARPIAPARRLSPEEAIGLVLAEPLVAAAAVPCAAIALREGYAVSAADLVGASPYSPILLPMTPRRVAAGQDLPPGTDAVLPFDAVTLTGGLAEAFQAVPPGNDVRRSGEDARAGTLLREVRRVFRPIDRAIACQAGIEQICVRQPLLSIVADGPEATSPAATLIAAFAARCGALVETMPHPDAGSAGDAEVAGIIVTIADDPAEILAGAEEIIATGLAIQPGERIACALRDGCMLLVVPPRLDAALAACLLVLRPCVAHLTGAAVTAPDVAGRLTRKLSSAPGLTELVLLRRTAEGCLEPLATGNLPLAAIAGAEAWFAIPPDSEGLAEGSSVSAFALASAFA